MGGLKKKYREQTPHPGKTRTQLGRQSEFSRKSLVVKLGCKNARGISRKEVMV